MLGTPLECRLQTLEKDRNEINSKMKDLQQAMETWHTLPAPSMEKSQDDVQVIQSHHYLQEDDVIQIVQWNLV